MNAKHEKQIAKDSAALDEVLATWQKDSVVDKAQPNEDMANIGSLHAKYLRILSTHKLNCKKAEKDFLEMKRLRAAYYEGTLTEDELKKRGWEQYLGRAPRSSATRDHILETDEYLLTIAQRKVIYEQIVEVCQYILKELNNRTWELREFMQWERTIRNG